MNSVINKILFATDLRDESRPTFHYSVKLASQLEAELSIIFVMKDAPESVTAILINELGEDRWKGLQEQQQDDVRKSLIAKRSDYEAIQREMVRMCAIEDKHCNESMFDNIPLVVERGDIAEKVLKYAENHSYDLIVMGAHTALFGKKTIGGSTKAVLNKAKVPVIVVPPPES